MQFVFTGRRSVEELTGALIEAGWRIRDGDRVSYLTDPDMFEWKSSDLSDVARVLEELEAARISNGSCAAIFTWGDSDVGGSFLIDSFGESVTLDPVRNKVTRKDVDAFLDFEWYLGKVIPCFESLGLSGFRIADLPG
ncbi:hypothetical protein ACIQB5_15535 [Streptomyces sp. NPDC088560]|uniref:hypothetical protein n=1 Tax=Streptomyces sp. NPDC088560 TaxID=3365868 RepID=UPI0037F48EE7